MDMIHNFGRGPIQLNNFYGTLWHIQHIFMIPNDIIHVSFPTWRFIWTKLASTLSILSSSRLTLCKNDQFHLPNSIPNSQAKVCSKTFFFILAFICSAVESKSLWIFHFFSASAAVFIGFHHKPCSCRNQEWSGGPVFRHVILNSWVQCDICCSRGPGLNQLKVLCELGRWLG